MNKEEELIFCLRQLDCEDRAVLLEDVRNVYREEVSRKPAVHPTFQVKEFRETYQIKRPEK